MDRQRESCGTWTSQRDNQDLDGQQARVLKKAGPARSAARLRFNTVGERSSNVARPQRSRAGACLQEAQARDTNRIARLIEQRTLDTIRLDARIDHLDESDLEARG